MYEHTLQIYENTFGMDHVNTANAINNLGLAYDSEGKYDAAIAQYEQSLWIKKNAFGLDHIKTAGTVMNIGSTYQSQGKYDEAIAILLYFL